MDLKETIRCAHQRLRLMVAQIIQEELEDCIGGMRFTGSYEGEEFNVIITLQCESENLEQREARMRRRVRQLGYDIGLFVEYPEETITV